MAALHGAAASGRLLCLCFSMIASVLCAVLLLSQKGGWQVDFMGIRVHKALGSSLLKAGGVGLVASFRELIDDRAGTNASEGPPTPPVHRVVYVKTHATASSTLTNIFNRFCEVYRVQCFSAGRRQLIPDQPIFDSRTLRKKQLLMILDQPWSRGLDVFPVHTVFEPEVFDRLIPNSVTVSSFREPKERIVSMIAHYPGTIQAVIDNINRGKHIPCGYFSWLMSEQVRLEDFHALDFVLLTEKFHLSLAMMRRRFGWRLADILYRPIKVSRETYRERAVLMSMIKNPANASVRRSVDSLFSCTAEDGNETLLYKMAQEKFREQWESFGVAEQSRLLEEVNVTEATMKELWKCCEKNEKRGARTAKDPYCAQLRIDDTKYAQTNDPASRRRATSVVRTYLDSPCWKKLPTDFK